MLWHTKLVVLHFRQKNKIKIYLPPLNFYRIVFLQANFEFINFVQTFCSKNTVTLTAMNNNRVIEPRYFNFTINTTRKLTCLGVADFDFSFQNSNTQVKMQMDNKTKMLTDVTTRCNLSRPVFQGPWTAADLYISTAVQLDLFRCCLM